MLRRRGVSTLLNHAPSNTTRLPVLPIISTRMLSTQRRPSSTLTVSSAATGKAAVDDTSDHDHYSPPPPNLSPPPLATIPTTHLLRTILITSLTTTPFLSSMLTRFMLNYTPLLTSNPFTRAILHNTFYTQFCAGATQSEIQTTVNRLKSWGFSGIILAYAKEVVVSKSGKDAAHPSSRQVNREEIEEAERNVQSWLEGTLKTIEYSEPGSFVAVKYSGAGGYSLSTFLPSKETPSPNVDQLFPPLMTALDKICTSAADKNIAILFDAEQHAHQPAMDALTMDLMKRYNSPEEKPIIYNTYQMYTRRSPQLLQQHLEIAERENFSFGAKVVRGAYLHSDPKEVFWADKGGTDKAYDDGIRSLLEIDEKGEGKGVKVGVVVATHNQESVDRAKGVMARVRKSRGFDKEDGEGRVSVVFAQLAGMADEVSMSCVGGGTGGGGSVVKYIPWGTLEECVKYLLRRADENKDSLKRTEESRRAAWKEVWRRMWSWA